MGENAPNDGPAAEIKQTGTPPPRRSSTTDLILTHNRLLKQDVVDAILADRKASAQLPPPPRRRTTPQFCDIAAWLALALILASGLYFRWANLGAVQHFGNDNGRDYYVLLEWARDGKWPLLGPGRITHDFTIGPGWFYTLAPAVFISRFNLAAGAGTVGLIGVLGALLAFFWVRRTTRSRLAGLAVAAMYCWANGWVESQRECWNPHPLFFGLTACAVAIHEARRHPLGSLALYFMLLAMLPQWHTTGWSLVVVSLPFFAWNLWRGRERLKLSSRRARWMWGIAAFVWFAALYAPPIIHEVEGGRNLRQYFENTVPSRRGIDVQPRPLLTRLADAADGLSRDSAQRNFDWYARLPPEAREYHYHAYANAAILALFALALTVRLRRERRPGDEFASVVFLAALTLAYFVLRVAQDGAYFDYFGAPWFAVPVLLAGWAGGSMLRGGELGARRRGRWLSASTGLASVLALFGGAALQVPEAYGIHRGRVWHGETFMRTQQIAESILREADGRPISLMVGGKEGIAASAEFHALLWLGGNRPLNFYTGNKLRRAEFGKVLFLVARGDGVKIPIHAEGLIDWIAPPASHQDALIYKLYPENIPADSPGIRFNVQNGVLLVRPLPAESKPAQLSAGNRSSPAKKK